MHHAGTKPIVEEWSVAAFQPRLVIGSLSAKVIAFALIALFSIIASPGLGEITDQDIISLAYEGTTATVEIPESPGIGKLMFRLGISLAIVFGLIVVVARLAKKYLPQQTTGLGGNEIQVLATRSLGGRKNLMLVQVEGKKVLIGVTQQNMQFLTHVDTEDLEWGDAASDVGLGSVTQRRRDLDAVHA